MESVLAVDVGSGGASAAMVTRNLDVRHLTEDAWTLYRDETGIACLSPTEVVDSVNRVVRMCAASAGASLPPAAIVLSSMMHSLLVTDADGRPRTPILTWLDTARHPREDALRQRLGADYRRRTGTFCHPSFPAYKIARLRERSPGIVTHGRIFSLSSWLRWSWTRAQSEDVATASASGLLNLSTGVWDAMTLEALELTDGNLPAVVAPATCVGRIGKDAALRTGLPDGLPVIAGAGDGFLASIGSGCTSPARLAITLGTTAGVRTVCPHAKGDGERGLFCYRMGPAQFLTGCAGNNGGNVLDWARNLFGAEVDAGPDPGIAPPVFLPFVFGERAPFWDTSHTARWYGISPEHTPNALTQSVVEAVVFVLASYIRLVSETIGRPEVGILSGNGFRTPGLAGMLAALVPFPLVTPQATGTATLKGAGAIAFEALGDISLRSLAQIDGNSTPVPAIARGGISDRFRRFASLYSTPIV